MRPIGLALPLCGLAMAVLGTALWFSSLSWRWLDALVGVSFAVGLALSLAAYARRRDIASRRLAIVGLGSNALGLLGLTLLYATG